MLEIFGSGLISLWLDMAGVQVKPREALDALAWQTSPGMVVAPDPSPVGATTVKQYLEELSKSKLVEDKLKEEQGVWLQSGPILMANHQGTTPLPAASLTKIATSLATLHKLGPDHQFETLIGASGVIEKGELKGDLVIVGGGDPLFVSEEAIALGNTLNKMGIKRVTGNLIISGNFAMNFDRNPMQAGQLLKQTLNYSTWARGATYQHSIMPKGTPKPQVIIAGQVKVVEGATPQTLLVKHHSLPLKQLVNEMNVFSNNDIAQMLADSIGGHTVVQATATELAGVPQSEIQLINGSGLGPENRISPRAACAMLMALQKLVAPHKLTLADLLPTAGMDTRGTTHGRHMPNSTPFKTGTLRDVSALAGVIPTRDRGLVWFAVINRGHEVMAFRDRQDKFLQNLSKELQPASEMPAIVTPNSTPKKLPEMGSALRNEIMYKK